MAERPSHEFLNPLRRADEARISRSIKPAQRVQDGEAARGRRQDERAARAEVGEASRASRTVQREEGRSVPRAAVPAIGRIPIRQGQARGGLPRWLLFLVIVTMAAGFAGALFYLGSSDLGNSNGNPATVEDWQLKGK
jgi:hypothetical protein